MCKFTIFFHKNSKLIVKNSKENTNFAKTIEITDAIEPKLYRIY